MVAIHLIANCQRETIELLIEHMLPEATVRAIDYSRPEALCEETRRAFHERLKEADFILVQPGGLSFLDHVSVKQEFLNKTFVMANFYFRGLFPDSCYLGDITDRFQEPSLYHSVAVLDAFKKGKSEKAAAESLCLENFQRLGLMEAWDSSLEEMRRRDAMVDLPVAGLIDSYCRERPGFLAVNHPSIALMYVYLRSVFDQLGIKHRTINVAALKDPLRVHDMTPILDDVAVHYELPYRTTQHWFSQHLGQKFMNRAEYVKRCYAAYRAVDTKRLTVHSPLDMVESLRRLGIGHLV